MSKKRVKQYLTILSVIGLVSIASGSGTFASFSAQTTNTGNTFSAGTLFLHDTANGTTTCTSESQTTGPNYNIDPTGGSYHASIDYDPSKEATIRTEVRHDSGRNVCLIDSVGATCTWSKTNIASPTFIALPANCSGLYVSVQETDSTYTVPSTDVYCAFGPSASQPDCSAPNNTATLASLTASTQLKTTGNTNATLTAGQTRYYVITIDPSGVGSGNALQNLTATFDLRWHIDH